ncbi:MAG: toxin-antitoxin system YwqK family antitoxin [Gammaproteobacteria bacterium]
MKIIHILIIILVLSGCDNNSFLEKLRLMGNVTSVIKIRDDIAYLPNDDEAFSGRYETYYPNGQKKKSVSYKNGRINGSVTYWNKNGQVIVKQSYKDGKPDELFTSWQKNGQKRLEKISQGR